MPFLDWLALLLALAAAVGLLAARNWRWHILFLALQYAAVFWFVQTQWGLTMAAVKLITGWMICAILSLAHSGLPQAEEREDAWPQGQLFRLTTIGITLILSFAAAGALGSWLGTSLTLTWGALFLTGAGLLILGITSQPFRAVLGLLTLLAGFETLYAAVESSVLVAGLLAAINLGLALVGAHYLNLTLREETE